MRSRSSLLFVFFFVCWSFFIPRRNRARVWNSSSLLLTFPSSNLIIIETHQSVGVYLRVLHQTMETRSSSSSSSPSAKKLKLCFDQTTNNGDKFSNLPDNVLHHILSLLDMKHAAQTSVLSRRWRYLCNSIPLLSFNSEFFRSNPLSFRDFIDQVLLLRDDSDIKSFHVTCEDACDISNHFHRWILVALRRNVQELSFDIDMDQIYRFPECLFTSKSLTILRLQTGGFDSSKIILPDSMELPTLKNLNLDSFSFYDENLTNKFFSSCPLLETLILTNCVFFNMVFCISSPKLKKLILLINCKHDDYVYPVGGKIKLSTPNLAMFTCTDEMSSDYSLDNLPSLVKASVYLESEDYKDDESYTQRRMEFLKVLQNVEDLTLSLSFPEVVSNSRDLLDRQSTRFSNLRSLKLDTWLSKDCIQGITYLLKISPNIETLSLEICQKSEKPIYPYCDEININSSNIGDYWEAGLSLECLLHHLKSVEIRSILGCVNELKLLEIILMNAVVLKKVVVSAFKPKPASPESDGERRLMKFSEKILAFPRVSSSTTFVFFS